MRFLSGGRIKNQKRLNCADRRDLMLCEREELLFKVGANTILPPKQRNICPRKAPQKAQHTNFFDKMVKWVAHDTIGALLPIRMTNFSNTKWEHNRNNKRKIWNKKLCCHKWTYCLLLFGNLKYTCCILFGWNFFLCNLRWTKQLLTTMRDSCTCIEGGGYDFGYSL